MNQQLKLSEAIRLGAMLRPQAFGRAFKDDGSCALGAALEATGTFYNGNQPIEAFAAVAERWPEVSLLSHELPCACHKIFGATSYLPYSIAHLSDLHRWSRAQIADWVETVEKEFAKQQTTPAAPSQESTQELMAAK